jgi:DNA-directed RNA polymerase subunit M/transcription elongation factor TFIIS
MKVERVEIADELFECPKCGGGGGFHAAFRRKEDRRCEVVLVCPSCRFRFTVGEFLFPTGEQRPVDPAMDETP